MLSETIAASYQHTAFGELLACSGTLQHPWRYAGKRLDTETGLVYFGHRYYDPTLSRWLTTDPAGFHDSLNLYQYVLNNPFRYYDPDGQFALVFTLPLTSAIFPAALAFLTAPVSIPVLAAVAVGSVACVAIATHPELIDHTMTSLHRGIENTINFPVKLMRQSDNAKEAKLAGKRGAGHGGGQSSNPDDDPEKDDKFLSQLEKQYAKDGSKSISKSYRSLRKLSGEHTDKLSDLQYKSSVEREIRTFDKQIRTIEEFAKSKNIDLFGVP